MSFIDDAELLARLGARQRAAIEKWLAEQPRAPRLIGPTASARVLGVLPPHISRLRDQGRLRPIPVEGSADVYIRSEVEELAAELAREREERAARREAKTA